MSLQELDPQPSESSHGEHTGNTYSTIDWFRKTFPHFWTPKIVAARNGTSKDISFPNKKKPQTWWSVARNVHGIISHVSLNINLKDKTYKLVCKTSDREWSILESTLLQATSQGTEWVTILLGDKSLIRLKRAELVVAYTRLKSLI